jgi:hypothetical protein
MKKLFLFCLINVVSLPLYGMDAHYNVTNAECLSNLLGAVDELGNSPEFFPPHNEEQLKRALRKVVLIDILAISTGAFIHQSVHRDLGLVLMAGGSFSLLLNLSKYFEEKRVMNATEATASNYLKENGWTKLLISPNSKWQEHLANVNVQGYEDQLITNNNQDLAPRLRASILASLPASHKSYA